MKKVIILLLAMFVSIMTIAQEKSTPPTVLEGEELVKVATPFVGNWTALVCNQSGAAATMDVSISVPVEVDPKTNSIITTNTKTVTVKLSDLNIGNKQFVTSVKSDNKAEVVKNSVGVGLRFSVEDAGWDVLLFMNSALLNTKEDSIVDKRLVGKAVIDGDTMAYIISVPKVIDTDAFLESHKSVCKDDKLFHAFAFGSAK